MQGSFRNWWLCFLFLIPAFLVLFTDLPAQDNHAGSVVLKEDETIRQITEAFEDWFLKTMKQENTPGLAVVLADRKGVVWSAGFGILDETSDQKVTPETLFSLQSVSKAVTTTGILIAVQEGLLDLDAPITKYLPDFRVNSRYEKSPEKKMTLRLLLSHRGGFTHEAPVGNNYDLGCSSLREHAASISDTWLRYPVGQRYSYSNLGIDLAGYILEVVSGMPFEKYMKVKLLDPLGMKDSTYDWNEIGTASNRAAGHDPEHDMVPLEHALIPCGGCYSSASDMAKFIRFHLNEGKVGAKQLIDRDLLSEMTRHPHPVESSVFYYTLGLFKGNWFAAKPFKHDYFHHSGGGLGFRANMKWFPEYGIGVTVLTNSSRSAVEMMNDTFIYNLLVNKLDSEPLQPKSPAPETIPTDDGLVRAFLGKYGYAGKDVEILSYNDQFCMKFRSGGQYPLNFVRENEAFIRKEGEDFYTFFRFMPSEKGGPRYIVNLNRGDTYDLHESPDDKQGPDKEEWNEFVGEYDWIQWGKKKSTIKLHIVNGHLYLGDERLTEHKPRLFFTNRGEALEFKKDRVTFRNVLIKKQVDDDTGVD